MRVLIQNLSPGIEYNVQFRSRSADSTSDWSRTFVLDAVVDTTPPSVPLNVSATVNGSNFDISWDAVPETDLYQYDVSIKDGLTTHIVPVGGESTTYTLDLSKNRALFGTPHPQLTFAVRAVDETGNKSDWSESAAASNPVPAPPTDFNVYSGIDSISGEWLAPEDLDIIRYEVYIAEQADAPLDTLCYSGANTQFITNSLSYSTDLYFKVVSVDVFEQKSTAVEAGPVRPRSSTGVDSDAPDTPADLQATIHNNESMTSATATVTWTPPSNGDNDLAGYTVAYRPVGAMGFATASADTEASSLTIPKLDIGVDYEFKIRAYDYSANQSPWSEIVVGSADDTNAAPSQPYPPTVKSQMLNMQVVHDLRKVGGGTLEADVVTLRVYAGDTADFTISDEAIVGDIPVTEVFSTAIGNFSAINHDYIKVTAIDRGGLESVASDAAEVEIAPLDWEYIANVHITNAQIESLEANKITGGEGIIDDITVKSILTLGDENNDGVIQSQNFGAGTGFRLSRSGLVINEGSISAKALNIQLGNNIVPSQFADFEWQPSSYILPVSNASASIVSTDSKFNYQCLRLVTTAPGGTVTLGSSFNIPVEAGQRYIVSLYTKSSSLQNINVEVAYNSAPTFTTVFTGQSGAGGWKRISGAFTVPSGATSAKLQLKLENAATVMFDGIQVERRLGSSDSPSAWNPPSTTLIDGAQIRTGEIRSTQNITVNGITQPAWSINMTGGAQFGNANVRGRLTVGGDDGETDAGKSIIQSTNYLAGSQGWVIRSDGYAEFRNLAVNSIKVTTLDSPLQNTVATKLYDYLEDFSLWQVRAGAAQGKTNQPGAFSAKALAEATGDTVLTRDTHGIDTGLAFEPEVLYRVTGRVRQVTSDDTGMEIPQVSIGVIGFDQNGVVCGYDGGTSIYRQYEVAASSEELSRFDGTTDEQEGWQTFVGFIKGRDANTGTRIWPTEEMVDTGNGLLDGFETWSLPNLEESAVPFGDFEDELVTGWNAYGAGTVTVVSDSSLVGNASLKLTGGGVRGAYTSLSSSFAEGTEVRINFMANQTLGGDTYAPFIVARTVGGVVTDIATFDAQTTEEPDPVSYEYIFTVPAGETMDDIYIYQNVDAASTGSTMLDSISAAISSEPVPSVPVDETQRIDVKKLHGAVQSGIVIEVPASDTNAALKIDYTRSTTDVNIVAQVLRADFVINEVASSNKLSDSLSVPIPVSELEETLRVRIYMTPVDSAVDVDNAYMELSNFDITIGAGSAKDPFSPAALHDNVRYIAPYVRLNESAPGKIAQLDAFTIETFEAGAQTKVSTTDGTGKQVTIESLDAGDSGFDHGVRFYSGESYESLPGIIAQSSDEEQNAALTLTLAPPVTSSLATDYGSSGSVQISSRNANLLTNSSFELGELGQWVMYAGNSTVEIVDDMGREEPYATKVTATAGGGARGLIQTIEKASYDVWEGATQVTLSAYVMPLTRPARARLRFRVLTEDESGNLVSINTQYSNFFESIPVGEYTRVSWTAYLPEGLVDEASVFEYMAYCTTGGEFGIAEGDQWVYDDMQMEIGNLTEYKGQASSSTQINTDNTFINNSLYISQSGPRMVAPGLMLHDAPDKSRYPSLFMANDSALFHMTVQEYDNASDSHRVYFQISARGTDESSGDTDSNIAGGLRIYPTGDEEFPGRVLLFNKDNGYLLYSKDKFGDQDKQATTRDIWTDGWMTSSGDAPWEVIDAKNPFSHDNTGHFYTLSAYRNGDTVYFRGGLVWNSNNQPSAGQQMTVVLPEKFRPPIGVRLINTAYGSGANLKPFVMYVRTNGVVDMEYISTGGLSFANGCYIPFEGISYSVAPDLPATSSPADPSQATPPPPKVPDTTAPGKPSNFRISARSSGKSSGSYTLRWSNPGASDLAGVKIIWRTDRYPSVKIAGSGTKRLTTDGKVIAISGGANDNKVFTHKGLPVNKTIYYRVVAYDKTGNHSSYVQAKRYLLKSPIIITANSTATWGTNYSAGWQIPGGGDDLIQAQWYGYDDHYRGLWFYGSKIYDQLNKGGVRRKPTSMQIYIYRKNSSHGSSSAVGITLHAHPHKSRPSGSGAPTLNGTVDNFVKLKRGQGATAKIPSSWYGNFANGGNRGLAIYDTASSKYAIVTGKRSYAANGKLTIYHNG